MNILMMTNTFTPHVGGVARSVEGFSAEYRRKGHAVMTIAPEFPNMDEDEQDVLRVPALRRFNHTDFSVRLPIPVHMQIIVDRFKPDIIHSHHPFMLGASALRLAHQNGIPLVFTHHTMYERYTHYVPGDGESLKHFVADIATGYANLCDEVFAPSESLAAIIEERGVTAPIDVVPTGVELGRFKRGDGPGLRDILGIPRDAFVVGHVGRLAPEKNLGFLSEAAAIYLEKNPNAHFLLVGSGPSLEHTQYLFEQRGLSKRLTAPGTLTGPFLVSAYKAMDVFAFASQTETQGMVLTEAMAASTPVVAVDASGVREVVRDRQNGILLPREDLDDFVEALNTVAEYSEERVEAMKRVAYSTAEDFSLETTSAKALRHYEHAIERGSAARNVEGSAWKAAIERARTEWDLFTTTAGAVSAAILPTGRHAKEQYD